ATVRPLSFNPVCSFFFFQAEDGIRDGHVTGVQTCALPISSCTAVAPASRGGDELQSDFGLRLSHAGGGGDGRAGGGVHVRQRPRSEERRVGKEWRSRWWRDY